jgi:rhodanese-related sulfurtransferase
MIDQVRPNDLTAWLQAQPGIATPWCWMCANPGNCKPPACGRNGFDLLAIPMGEIPAAWASWTPNPVACLCHHGARSQRVASFLARTGFTGGQHCRWH